MDASYSFRMAAVGILTLCSSVIMYSLQHTAPGYGRVPVALIITLCNLVAPLLFHRELEIVTAGVTIFMVTWLGTFKAVGWSVGRGPLSSALTLSQFVVTMSMPITPVVSAINEQRFSNARQGEFGESARGAAYKFVLKLGGLVVFVTCLQSPHIPRLVQEVLYLFAAYCFLGIIMQCVGFFTIVLLGMRVAPHFDSPFLSASLADFWSRRWNLNTGYTLRFMVYEPIIEGQLLAKVKVDQSREGDTSTGSASTRPSRRCIATCAAFLVSGVMHEVFIVYLRGVISWYWFSFFVIQGPLVCAESFVRGWARKRRFEVPQLVAVVATLSALLAMADALFFYDILRMGLPQQVVSNLYETIQQVAHAA